MKVKMFSFGISLILSLLTPGAIHSQESASQPNIDPEADTVLHQLSEHMKKIPAAIFRVTDTIDDVQADGQKLQFAHIRELTVVRPNKLRVETTGDVTNRTVWKDGKTLTVLDRDKNIYAQIQDPGTIDQALEMLQEKYGMSMPGADLLSADVYKTLTEGCSAINYIGIGLVGEEKCHHLAFTRENIDWQLWVSLGENPAPRKMVITYKQVPGEPQYTQQLLKVEDASKINDSMFTCEIPKDAEKIDFQPVATPE